MSVQRRGVDVGTGEGCRCRRYRGGVQIFLLAHVLGGGRWGGGGGHYFERSTGHKFRPPEERRDVVKS